MNQQEMSYTELLEEIAESGFRFDAIDEEETESNEEDF